MGGRPNPESRLRASQAYNRSLIEACAAPLLVVSTTLEITDVNEEAVRLTRTPRSDLVRTPLRAHFDVPPSQERVFRQAFAAGQRTKVWFTLNAPTSRRRNIPMYASTFIDPFGEPRGVFVASPD